MVDVSPLLVLDACCAINLLASERIEEVLGALVHRPALARRVVEEEVLHLPGTEPDSPPRVVTLQPLVDSGGLALLSPQCEEEMELFVSLASDLDDGEAMSAAIAIGRGGSLATDDRKAMRLLGDQAPGLDIIRTSDLMREWAARGRPSRSAVAEALGRIERHASFVPPRSDPNFPWWQERRSV